jgi:2-phospho-L-lactate/phosphoenolpyruvate guanylyltransferase
MGRRPARAGRSNSRDRRRAVTSTGGGYASPVQATVASFDPVTRSGSVLLDDGTELPYSADAFDAGGLLRTRVGQRVRIRTTGSGSALRISFLTLVTLPD